MIKWIKDVINPPGIHKPNRLAVFSLIGEVADKIKVDALKAFNAHFPYLADEAKLDEHGMALLVPRLLEDTQKEYRDRVSTASFFLMRAGERAYIIGQLNAHFGDRYVVSDEFLNVYVKVLEISDADRSWLHEFLDGLLNPNILLTVADWFRFVEAILITESQRVTVKSRSQDLFAYTGTIYCDGRWLCDQGGEVLCDGWPCDGSTKCDRFKNTIGTVTDNIHKSIYCNGVIICGGGVDCSGYETLTAETALPLPIMPHEAAGDKIKYAVSAGTVTDGVNVSETLSLTIRTAPYCDGSRTPHCALCDGSIVCDGSYTGFDGWYCREDILQEDI